LIADVDLSTLNLGKNPERVVLLEVKGEDGSAEIVYRAGGQVNVRDVEELCSLVGWPKRQPDKLKGALENSFLVCFERDPALSFSVSTSGPSHSLFPFLVSLQNLSLCLVHTQIGFVQLPEQHTIKS
jgi:hypothetical protein